VLLRACLHRTRFGFSGQELVFARRVLCNHSSASATSVTFRALASAVTLLFSENVGRVLRLRFYHRTVVPIAPLPFERATGLPDKVMPIHRAPPWSEVIYIYIYIEREREKGRKRSERTIALRAILKNHVNPGTFGCRRNRHPRRCCCVYDLSLYD